MCGASSGQKDVGAAQTTFMNTMMQQSGQVFGDGSQIFGDLTAAFQPTLAAGPNQEGFSPAEKAAMNASVVDSEGQAARNAKAATGNAIATVGGNTVLPSGTADAITAGTNEKFAQATAAGEQNVVQQDYAQGRQNFDTAAQVLSGATNVFNPGSSMSNSATGASSAASTTENEISQADSSWMTPVAGILGGAMGMAGQMCPAEGSMYLMADGSEKPVEALAVGDLLQGVDDEAQTIEEIQSDYTNVVCVITEDGHVLRNSPTHAYALPKGGFVVAAKSFGKTIVTGEGTSKVISVVDAGKAWVFNVITNGSHTYRADGVWSLGVGEAERHVGMNVWARVGTKLMEGIA